MNATNFRLPFPFKTGPDVAPDEKSARPEVLPEIRLEPSLVRKFAHEANAAEMAVQAVEALFHSIYGVVIKTATRLLEALSDELAYGKGQVALYTASLETSKQFHEEANAGVPTMDRFMKGTQWALLAGCFLMAGLEWNALAMSLKSFGEPFLTPWWSSYVVALSGAPALAALVKCFISVPKNEKAKDALAALVIVVGLTFATYFILVISRVAEPDFTAVNLEGLLSLGASSPSDPTSVAPPTLKPGRFFMFSQVVSGACGSAALMYYYVKNRERFRTHVFMKSCDYKAFQKERATWEATVTALTKEIGQNEGSLSQLEHLLVNARLAAIADVRQQQRRNEALFGDDDAGDAAPMDVRPGHPRSLSTLNGNAHH